jgi:hypothetical protein
MKSLLIAAFGFVAASALACPLEGAKDAMAPSTDKSAVAKAKPANSTSAASTKNAATKVAVKPATAPRKSATL